jgi:hypothetical protein
MNARLAVMCAAVFAMPLGAQRGGAPACARPDTNAQWYRDQRVAMDDSRRDWSSDTLRVRLLAAAGVDPAAPLTPQWGWQVDGRAPAAGPDAEGGVTRLRQVLRAGRGSAWPTRSVVGAAGVRAVWTLAQQDTALERAALRRMMEAGLGESIPADVAVLEDRVRLLSSRKQLYGTQLSRVNERLVVLPIEDSAHVDLRRDAAGLPPLRQAVCAAGTR